MVNIEINNQTNTNVKISDYGNIYQANQTVVSSSLHPFENKGNIILFDINITNQIDNLFNEFILLSKTEIIESCYTNGLDVFAKKISHFIKESEYLIYFYNKLSENNNNYLEFRISFLYILPYFKPTNSKVDIYHIPYTIANSYDNIELKELAIRVYENWNDKFSLEFLKLMNFENSYLNNYKQNVIKDISANL